ncbi:glycosyltransferase [Amycolatopsis sp. VC5-11]|uniref:glycosyltransferase n=1 Tax=Amycolatopsis sp. VC5-11 TaxID=3120156 RepID=UPI0030097B69
MKIFYWLADYSGCGYYRCLLPGVELAKRGHDVMADGRVVPDEAKNGECDVIVGQRVCTVGASHTWQKLARAGHTRLVFETDDLLSEVDPSNRQAHRFYDEERVRRYHENMAVADVITVTTDRLAEHARTINRTAAIHVLPNQIPGWLLDHERPKTGDLVTIGWRGGLSHGRDFGELAKPLRRFLQHPDNRDRAEFHAMGAPYHERVATRHGRTRWTGWHEAVGDFLRAVDFDLAVIPLRPSRFNEAKSDLALVEMSALGIPAIVSDFPGSPYRVLNGYAAPVAHLASRASDWTDHLRYLVNDAEAREQLGKQAKEWAAGRTIEGNAHRWEEAYSS